MRADFLRARFGIPDETVGKSFRTCANRLIVGGSEAKVPSEQQGRTYANSSSLRAAYGVRAKRKSVRSGASGVGVASYHLSVKAISRSAGRSATAAIAYRAGVAIRDERTQELHDYSRRGGVDRSYAEGIALPEGAPTWAHDREALWNAAEIAETRKNSTVAREFEIALPAQLSPEGRRALVKRFSKEIAAEHRIAVEACIHLPSRNGDQRNHHAHILTSTRRLGANGFGEKARELDDQRTGAQYVEKWRRRFGELGSDALRAEGFVLEAERFRHGHMTKEQQLQKALHRGDFQFFSANAERPAAAHLGPAATGFERRTGELSRLRFDATNPRHRVWSGMSSQLLASLACGRALSTFPREFER